MQYTYAEKVNAYAQNLFIYGLNIHEVLKRVLTHGDEIEINPLIIARKQLAEELEYTDEKLTNEIRINLLELTHEGQRHHYLYYLIKVYWQVDKHSRRSEPLMMEVHPLWKETLNKKKNPYSEIATEIIKECYWNFNEIISLSTMLMLAIVEEFGISLDEWNKIISPEKNSPAPPPLRSIVDSLILGKESNISTNTQIPTTQLKLKWIGKKTQLYHVLRQLKEQNLIGNTYDELVEFLHAYVTGFENSKKDTTSGALNKRDPPPKISRVKLDLEKEE